MSLSVQYICLLALFSAAHAATDYQLLANENNVTLKRDANGNLGWWESNEESVVFAKSPTKNRPSELRTTDGLCVTLDGSSETWAELSECTGEQFILEDKVIRRQNHAGVCLDEGESVLLLTNACNYQLHYVQAPVVYEPSFKDESYCGKKFEGKTMCGTFQDLKLCCAKSHKCGKLPTCSPKTCCKPDTKARYLIPL